MAFKYPSLEEYPSWVFLQKILKTISIEYHSSFTIVNPSNLKGSLSEISFEEICIIYQQFQTRDSQKYKMCKNWKLSELHLLLYAIDKYCMSQKMKNVNQLGENGWKEIALMMPCRTAEECQVKFLSLNWINCKKKSWSKEQQLLLLDILNSQKKNKIDWKTISQKLYHLNQSNIFRTPKQCRQHFNCFLKPNLKKGHWTDQQDYYLLKQYLKIGRKWSIISKEIEGRNQNAIKNRFCLLIQSKGNLKYIQKGNLRVSQIIKSVKKKIQKLQIVLEKNTIQSEEREGSIINDEQIPKNSLLEDSQINQSKTSMQRDRASQQTISRQQKEKEQIPKDQYLCPDNLPKEKVQQQFKEGWIPLIESYEHFITL